MAVSPAVTDGQPSAGAWVGAAVRPPRARHLVRLKLRVIANGLRGKAWRIALFVGGAFAGLWFAASGFLLFAAAGAAGNDEAATLIAAFGGALLVLGWLFLPLVFFGVDETLDPSRFALLPLPRRTLVTGMFAAALVGVAPLAMLIATAGVVVSAGRLGGWPAAGAAAVGIVGGLILCVALSRAVTSAFSSLLRSRRTRDLAAILLAVFAALLGPLQVAFLAAAPSADWQRFLPAARVLGWTPLAAPYTVGLDVAEGRAWAVPVKLLITAATVLALLWWWSRSLESAMLGAAASSGTARPARGPAGDPVSQLMPRHLPWLRPTRYGALVAREMRYWWRDARRRATLITFAVAGIFVPVVINVGVGGMMGAETSSTSLTTVTLSMVFVGILGAINLANQFGFDGSAYAANIVAGVTGRLELRARLVAYSAYTVPLLVLIAIVVGALLGKPAWIPAMLGALIAAYGAALAIVVYVSIFGAYALPETSNPFAINTGGGMAKSLLSLLVLIGAGAAATPVVVGAFLVGDGWLWLGPPIGLAYGVGAVLLGAYLAGDVLDRRMPELLAAVTPRR